LQQEISVLFSSAEFSYKHAQYSLCSDADVMKEVARVYHVAAAVMTVMIMPRYCCCFSWQSAQNHILNGLQTDIN